MAKKTRAFYDPERNSAISEAGPKFDLSDLEHVNHTELVQLCNLMNPDGNAHLGMKRKVLEEILQGVVPDDASNPVDKIRKRLHSFIQEHWEKIRDQMEVNCTGNCYQCHDFMVLGCYVTNADHLKRTPEEG
jgi:hypothetical protein